MMTYYGMTHLLVQSTMGQYLALTLQYKWECLRIKANYTSTNSEDSNDDVRVMNRSMREISSSMDKVIESYDILGKSLNSDSFNEQVSPVSKIDDTEPSPTRKNLRDIIQETVEYNKKLHASTLQVKEEGKYPWSYQEVHQETGHWRQGSSQKHSRPQKEIR